MEFLASAELDVDGVADLGPHVIDEVLSLYASAHPELPLRSPRTNTGVARALAQAGAALQLMSSRM